MLYRVFVFSQVYPDLLTAGWLEYIYCWAAAGTVTWTQQPLGSAKSRENDGWKMGCIGGDIRGYTTRNVFFGHISWI